MSADVATQLDELTAIRERLSLADRQARVLRREKEVLQTRLDRALGTSRLLQCFASAADVRWVRRLWRPARRDARRRAGADRRGLVGRGLDVRRVHEGGGARGVDRERD